jgi:heterodisulfide reductase subunit A2
MKGDTSSVAVLGAGIAGMQSALLLAELGRKVFLVEQGPAIGGYFPLLDKTFPTNSCGVCFMSPTPPAFCPIYECKLHEGIEVMPYSDVTGIEGEGGDFRVSILRKPRFVRPERCTGCGACFKACPVEVESAFGGGLEKRRAIYLPYAQAIPPTPVIDSEACVRCGECLKVCSPGAIDLDMKGEQETVRAGAILLGFGFEAFSAQVKGEYGFGRYADVMTSVQFERMLSTSSPSEGVPVRISDGKRIQKLAFIQCVGSRDPSCGQDHCSTICCMYATKQAMIAKDRSPDLDVTVFYMDVRPMGKDYERYYERAKSAYGIHYTRSAVSSIKQRQQTKRLLITSVIENGIFQEDLFDAVVLSLGFTPPKGVRELAQTLGVGVNPQGFCLTEEFSPAATSVAGIFVAGAFRGPRDIPETVVEGSSAAAAAASYLSSRSVAPTRKEYPKEGAIGHEIPRIGVFACHCGRQLKEALPTARLIEKAKETPEVVYGEEIAFACLPEGVDLIKRSLAQAGLNRIVLAGCSQREIRSAMEEMAREMGLNPSLIEFANIREQCAFVHEGHPEEAAEKASALIRMAIERARRSQPVQRVETAVEKRGLVIGGGVAGMTAALRLAEQGFEVYLVEKEKGLGGNLREAFGTLRGSDPQELLHDLTAQIEGQSLIHLFTESEVFESARVNGHFETKVRRPDKVETVKHSALILAVGGKEIVPKGYRYGEDPRVITQRQLEQRLRRKEGEGQVPGSVVMIQCAGSRDEEHPYCSRICCSHAVKNALALKKSCPEASVYVLYRDVRTYGFYETYYYEARRRGVIFIRYDEAKRPEVVPDDGALSVSVFDPALSAPVSLSADLVVLSTGIEPHDHKALAGIFDLELNPDGFFKEANPKSAPLDAVDRGKFFCGLCHSPNLIEDSISQGNAAAARASALLAKESIAEKPYPAYVMKRLCSGCGLCVSTCVYQARFLNGDDGKAEVIGSLCQGCGSCVIACRNGASQQRNFEKEMNLAVLDAAID